MSGKRLLIDKDMDYAGEKETEQKIRGHLVKQKIRFPYYSNDYIHIDPSTRLLRSLARDDKNSVVFIPGLPLASLGVARDEIRPQLMFRRL